MTREGTRPFAAIVAAMLVAAALAACGGSDSASTGSATTGSTTTAQGEGENQRSGSQDGSQGRQKKSKGSSQGQTPKEAAGSPPKNVATPLEVSGGGSAQFRTKGGDNSIQEYGEENESELREVAEIVHGFFVSRAEEKWEKACAYLAKSNVEQLEQLGQQSPELKNAGCGLMLKAFTRPLPAKVEREVTTVDAGSFRREGEQGFLIYYGAGHTAYAMPLREEGGSWKVAALSGSALG